jgi:arylsulfatase A-like enzyme
MHLPESMWSTYQPDQRKFFLLWFNQYTHEDVNGAAFLDDPITLVLQTMKAKGFLDDTLTIIMGDHGNR